VFGNPSDDDHDADDTTTMMMMMMMMMITHLRQSRGVLSGDPRHQDKLRVRVPARSSRILSFT
jgi:hypothetical protein